MIVSYFKPEEPPAGKPLVRLEVAIDGVQIVVQRPTGRKTKDGREVLGDRTLTLHAEEAVKLLGMLPGRLQEARHLRAEEASRLLALAAREGQS